MSAKIKKNVFVADSHPPYYYQDENNKIVGSAVEIVKKIAKNIDLEVTFEVLPWDECLQRVKDGSATAIVAIFKTREREEFLYYPKFGITTGQYGVFTSPNYNGERIFDINSLKGLKVGFVKAYSYPKMFSDDIKCEKVVASNQREALKLLVEGKIDALVGDIEASRFYLKEFENGKKCTLMPLVFPLDPSYLAISKKDPNSKEIYEKINKEIIRMKLSKEMYSLQGGLK